MRSEPTGNMFVPLDNTEMAHVHNNTTTTRVVGPVQWVRIVSMHLHVTICIAHSGNRSTENESEATHSTYVISKNSPAHQKMQ